MTGTRRGAGEAFERLVRVRAHHDRIDVAGEHARGVLGRLARADHEVAAVRDERVAAELRHPDFERDARAQARLFEEHPERLAAEQRQLIGAAGAFEMRCHAENRMYLGRREIGDGRGRAAPGGRHPQQMPAWSA